MPSKVVVSRKWNGPAIEAFYNIDEVGAACSVEDFINVLVEEVGNPTLLVTKAKLKEKLVAGWLKLEGELKDATRYV